MQILKNRDIGFLFWVHSRWTFLNFW